MARAGEKPVREDTGEADTREQDTREADARTGAEGEGSGAPTSGVCRSRLRLRRVGQAWAAAPWLNTTDW
jgi:hypothetical protein